MFWKRLINPWVLIVLLMGALSVTVVAQAPDTASASADANQIQGVLFFSDFEGTDGGLVGTLDWEWGTYSWVGGGGCSAGAVPAPSAHSGTDMWGSVLNTCYNPLGNNSGYNTCVNGNPDDDSVLSFDVDLSGVPSAELLWWEWFDVYLNWDWAEVYVNGDVVFQQCGTGYVAPTQWVSRTVDLTPYVGGVATIEFHMMASTVVNYAGWWIDDVLVTAPDFADLSTSYKMAPSSVKVGDPFPYTVVISNSGNLPALNAVMTDVIPLGTTYIPGSVGCSSGVCAYDVGDNAVYWLGEVLASEAVTVTFGVTCTARGPVTNTAVISDPILPAPVAVRAHTMQIGVPDIEVEPDGLGTLQPPDTTVNRTLIISNVGTGDLSWAFTETMMLQNLPSYIPASPTPSGLDSPAYTDGDWQQPSAVAGVSIPPAPDQYASPSRLLMFYGSRTVFDTHHPGLPVEGFENTLVPTNSLQACPGPFDSTTNNVCFAPGGILDGIRFQSSVAITEHLVVLTEGFLGMPSVVVGPHTYFDDYDILFPGGGVYAVGFDLYSPVGADTYDVYVFGPDNVLLGQSLVYVEELAGTFWGVYSPLIPITRIRTVSPSGHGELADDVAFGGSAIECGVPWATPSPVSGTLPPGLSTGVNVAFDSTGMMTGTYTGTLCILNNAPTRPPVFVPVTMAVYQNEWEWEKEVWINGEPSVPTSTVVPSDAVTIVDRAWITSPIPTDYLTLTENWDESLALQGWEFSEGSVITGTGTLAWVVEPVPPMTWLVLTKTFQVQGGDWEVGTLTETLEVENPAWPPEPVVLTFTRACVGVSGADFGWSPEEPLVDQTVAFTGTVAAGDSPISYTWDFDDGDVATGANVTHAFASVGDYMVWMTATNCEGSGLSTMSYTLSVTETVCEPPVITELLSNSPVELGQAMHFSATVTGDIPITYTWDFDGAGSQGGTDAYPTFTYDYTGTYTVTLVVDNGCAPTDTASLQVEVQEVGACDPVAITRLESDSPVELGQAMHFSATVTGDIPITYTWDFDGAGSQGGTDAYPTFTYDAADDYTVTLDVANGCPSTDTQTIQVRVNPTGTICIPVSITDVAENVSGCVVDFVPTYTGDSPITWSWSFPDGTPSSSSAESPTGIDFGVSGTYAYTVTATNCDSAQAVYTDTVTVSCGVEYMVYLPIVIKGD